MGVLVFKTPCCIEAASLGLPEQLNEAVSHFIAYTIGGCNVGLKVQTEISIGLTAMKSCYNWDHIDSSFVLGLYYCFCPQSKLLTCCVHVIHFR